MTTMDDMDLLREYVARESEQAFATLVSRHLDLVYSVALRHTGNPDHAQEITQAVFIILVRKATSLGPKTVLSGWLFNTTRLTARNFLRTEIRRTKREQETCMQSLAPESDENVWENVAPLLDQAVAGLGDKDRDAVVLRFIEGKSLREVGEALGVGEDSARMRVNRAVEKLRKFFTKRGVVLSGSVLATVISANSVQAAPAGIASSITAVSIMKGATAGSSTIALVKGTMKVMTWLKFKAVAVGTAVLLTTSAVTVGVLAKPEVKNDAVEPVIPLIVIDDAPLIDAIRGMAKQAKINYILDPNVPGSTFGPGRLASQPSVTLRWEKVTARAALNALLENQKLTMVINPATTVARIAPAKLDVKPVPAAQVGTDSNTIPLLTMENAPLLNVIKNLARQAGLNIAISPQVSAPDFSTQGFVTVRWEKITGRQALAAILDNYGLVMTEDAASSVAQITLK